MKSYTSATDSKKSINNGNDVCYVLQNTVTVFVGKGEISDEPPKAKS